MSLVVLDLLDDFLLARELALFFESLLVTVIPPFDFVDLPFISSAWSFIAP